jgi:predicted small secreted protein
MRTFLMITILVLSGCATVAGVGEDISTGAREVQGWF